MKIGILGTGGIVKSIVATLKGMENVQCYAIASRTAERAREAAEEYGFAKAYGSYEDLAADAEVELVYIATPHSCHYEDMKMCIRYGDTSVPIYREALPAFHNAVELTSFLYRHP